MQFSKINRYITIYNEKTHRSHNLILLHNAEYSTTDEFMIEYITQHQKRTIVFHTLGTTKSEEHIIQQVAADHKTLLNLHHLGTLDS